MLKAVVIADIAPLYTKPDKESELADEALFGMTVELLEETEDFLRVRTHYRYEGYAPAEALLREPELVEKWDIARKHVVTHPYLDLLKQPDVCAAKFGQAPRGGLVIVESLEEVNDQNFIAIRLPDGNRAFTKAVCLREQKTSWSSEDEAAMRDSLVETAMSYIGAQYRWGGKTPLGIDCSGLTSMSYMLNGSIIYRDASIQQGYDMREIPFSQIQKGDLVFYKGHVVMYIGDSMYIHSTANKSAFGVTINSFDEKNPLYRADLATGIVAAGSIF